jgi:hypothetical protein
MVKTNKRNQQILRARKKPLKERNFLLLAKRQGSPRMKIEGETPLKEGEKHLRKRRVKHLKKRVKHSLNSGNKHASFITLKPIPISVPMYMRTWLRVWLTSPKVKPLKYNPFISPVL